jgi:hypothetical protein
VPSRAVVNVESRVAGVQSRAEEVIRVEDGEEYGGCSIEGQEPEMEAA